MISIIDAVISCYCYNCWFHNY